MVASSPRTLISRRRAFLTLGASALLTPALLAACGAPAAPTTAPAAPTAAPKPAEPTKPVAAPAAGATTAPAAVATTAAAAPAKPSGPREVTFMSIGNEGEQKMFQDAIAAAQKGALADLNINLKFQATPGADWPKIMSMFAAGAAFDVQRTNDDHVYLLAVENKIHQLDNWIMDSKMKVDDYFPIFWRSLAIEGYQFSMNPAGGANVVYYNTDLFNQAGIKAPTSWKDAWSWEDFLSNARKLAKVSGNRTDVYAMGFPRNIALPIIYGAGAVALSDDQTKTAFGTKEVHDAVQVWVDLINKDKIVAPLDLDRLELFNAGKLAMNWESMGWDRNIGQNVKWDIMPWMKTPKLAMTENYDRTFTIAKSAKEPEAAFLAMKALCEKDASEVFAKGRFGIPYLKSVGEGPLINDKDKPPANKNVWFETFGDVGGRPVDIPLGRGPIGEVWKSSANGELFTSALAGQITVQQYIDQVTQRVSDEVAKRKWTKGGGEELLKKGGGLTHPNRKVLS